MPLNVTGFYTGYRHTSNYNTSSIGMHGYDTYCIIPHDAFLEEWRGMEQNLWYNICGIKVRNHTH